MYIKLYLVIVQNVLTYLRPGIYYFLILINVDFLTIIDVTIYLNDFQKTIFSTNIQIIYLISLFPTNKVPGDIPKSAQLEMSYKLARFFVWRSLSKCVTLNNQQKVLKLRLNI